MAGNTAPRVGKKRTRLDEASIKEEIERKKNKKPEPEEHGEEEEKDNAAPPVNIIRFLPDDWIVEPLLPPTMPFDTPEETVAWKSTPVPLMKVGMTRSLGASLTKGNVLSSNAFEEVFLRPRFSAKKNGHWYEFIDNGGRLLRSDMAYIDPPNRVEEYNNKTALKLLKRHRDDLEQQLATFTEAQIHWRCERRVWEYELVKWLYAKDIEKLVWHKKLQNSDLDVLATWVAHENQKDKNGGFTPWFMGRLDEANQIVVRQKDRDCGVTYDGNLHSGMLGSSVLMSS